MTREKFREGQKLYIEWQHLKRASHAHLDKWLWDNIHAVFEALEYATVTCPEESALEMPPSPKPVP